MPKRAAVDRRITDGPIHRIAAARLSIGPASSCMARTTATVSLSRFRRRCSSVTSIALVDRALQPDRPACAVSDRTSAAPRMARRRFGVPAAAASARGPGRTRYASWFFVAKWRMATATDKLFDALIIGAGPAGSYVGYLLARQGAVVGIIEKRRLPREKVCGGGVSRKAIELLDFDISPVVQRWIRGAHLRFRGRSDVLKNIDPPAACTVLRRQFDFLLLEQASAAGAQVFEATAFADLQRQPDRVEVQTDRGTMHCRVLLGADGVGSSVRSKALGKRIVRYVPALETLVPLCEIGDREFDHRAVFDFGALPRGYGWIFPKREHLNVGVYSPFGARQMRDHLQAFVASELKFRMPPDAKVYGFPIPVRNASGIFQAGRVWLLGDAAGLADGLFGEGIYFALRSAKLAARALQETAFAPTGKRYAQLLRQELLPELRASEWMGRALFAFPGFAFSHLVSNPRINDDFAGLISGAVGYRECLLRTLVRAPGWLLRTGQG